MYPTPLRMNNIMDANSTVNMRDSIVEKSKGSIVFKKQNSEEKKNVGNANETKNCNQNSEEAKKPQTEVIRSKKPIFKKNPLIKLTEKI